MRTAHKIGLGAFVLLMGASLLAMRPHPARTGQPREIAQAHLQARVAVDRRRAATSTIALLDARLQQLMTKPAMVGLAVGVVENGRITFLQGYGETLAGSGDPVTPETVFRWASVSKGVAATMVAKLAEQGKIDLDAPVANYAPDLKLPAGNEYRATVGDLLSHRLGLYRNAYDNKLEEGQDPSFLRASLAQLNAICPPGTCWSYQNVAYDASSEMVSRGHRHALRAGGQALPVQPDRDDQRQRLDGGLEVEQELGAAAQRRPAAAADGRHLLQGARRGRHQQQHQGHGAVDAGADGRDARRARRPRCSTRSTRR